MIGFADRVLTSRQERVLAATAEGMAGKHIARWLGISLPLVRHEQARIARKLGGDNGVQAVAIAYQIGLLPALVDLFRERWRLPSALNGGTSK